MAKGKNEAIAVPAIHQLAFEQARLALALGYGVRRPWMGQAFVQLRQAKSPAPDGYTQQAYAFTAADKAATDWEVI